MNIRHRSGPFSAADADALLSGHAVAGTDDLREIVGLMRTASAVPAPAPTAALAAVLHSGFDPLPVESARAASRWGHWGARIAMVTAAAMTATLGAATANALPASVQTAVADVVGAVTPLQLPRPPARTGTGSDDEDGATDQPAAVLSEKPEPEPDSDKAGSTPVVTEMAPSSPKAPGVVTPPRRPGVTATPTDEPDADEPDSDEPDADVPDADEPDEADSDAGEPETDETEIDGPEQAEAGSAETDQGDAGDGELLDFGETGLDGDAEAEQDEAEDEAEA